MSKEQAIKILDDLRSYDYDKIYDLYQNKPKSLTDALGLAIEALALPSVEPCEDAISRQAVIDVVEREQFKGDAISEIEKLPPVKSQDCDTCEVGNPCLYCKHEFKSQESEG